MRCLLPAGLASGLCALVLHSAEPAWQTKCVAGWTREEARQVLTNSPWAGTIRVGLLPLRGEDQLREGGRMGGASLRQSHLDASGAVEIRWESALPVRAAEMKAGETAAPEWDGDYYAIAVYRVPGVTPQIAKALQSELRQTTWLKRHGDKDLHPARVQIVASGGNLARITYLFPRSADLSRAGRIDFISQIGRVFVAHSFETGDMIFAGKIEM